MSDFEVMPIGTAKRLMELEAELPRTVKRADESGAELALLRGELGREKEAVATLLRRLGEERMERLGCIFCDFKAETFSGLREHSAACEQHPLHLRLRVVLAATDEESSGYVSNTMLVFQRRVEKAEAAVNQLRIMREAINELHTALAVCPGFKVLADDRVWSALNDTYASLGEK